MTILEFILLSFNTQDLPENHFGELEPPVKILLIIIVIAIVIVILKNIYIAFMDHSS